MKKVIIAVAVIISAIILITYDYTPKTESSEEVTETSDFLSELRKAQAGLTDDVTEAEKSVPERALPVTDAETVPDTTPETVYITPTGKKYHLRAGCGGKNSFTVSFDDALSRGLTPCKKCAQ